MVVFDAYRTLLKSGALQPDPGQIRIVETLDALATALARPKRRFGKQPAPHGLYLHGPVGRGKSMLMDLFFAAAPVAAKRRVHFNAFMLEVHRRLDEARQEKHADPLLHVAGILAAEAKLLCFDEFQVKDVADAMILARLFTALLDGGVVVVATSNVAPDDLYKGGLQRDLFLPFIALLKTRLDILAIAAGIDHRLARLTGKPVWFCPDDANADAALDTVFAGLAQGHIAAAETLDVQGRAVAVPLAAGRVARFTFAQLCRTALGAADYLAIADAFRVVILDHVPRFDPSARNEAARFVTLVDQFYEKHTILIVSAALPAGSLYPEDGPYAFEFRRTASRLAEMASAQYLSSLAQNADPENKINAPANT